MSAKAYSHRNSNVWPKTEKKIKNGFSLALCFTFDAFRMFLFKPKNITFWAGKRITNAISTHQLVRVDYSLSFYELSYYVTSNPSKL